MGYRNVWPATVAEIKTRGLEIHGSLSRRNVDDGETAVVLKATETKSGRVVAIKIYKDPDRKVAHRNGDTIPMSNFFENELRMLAGLQECPLVPKYYFSVASDDATSGDPIQPFHVMEFVEGQRITKYVSESLGGDKQAMTSLFREVLEAIDTIHQFGYLHRDLSDGNILVDRQGRIRLIDLAEASPLGDEHTRLVSTPGFGTEGVATEEQQHVRKIQCDDVRDACTIGYAMFTGQWKQSGQDAKDWRRNLDKSGTPKGITETIVKGMKPRDPNRKRDRNHWNSAREVIEAIDRSHRRQRARKRWIRNAIGFAAITAVALVIGCVAWERAQQTAYTSELSRLGKQRERLSKSPHRDRVDPRVQERVDAAEELETQAESAYRQGRSGEATSLLSQAVDEIAQASRIADNLSRLRPLIEPLRKFLLQNDLWNRDCPAIVRRLTDLGNDYQGIQHEVESGVPERAWELYTAIQPKLVQLIDDHQQSLKTADLMQQVSAQSIGLDAVLTESTAYQQIRNDCSRAARHYASGKWPEARTELLGAMSSMKSFLEKHESDAQRKNRLSSNADMVNAQLVANDSLQKQVKELTQQITDKKADYREVLFQGAQYKTERDDAQTQLISIRKELDTAKLNLETKLDELRVAQTQRDQLSKWRQEKEPLIADFARRLEQGSKARAEQTAELKRTKELLARRKNIPEVKSPTSFAELGELKLGKKFTIDSIGQESVYLPPGTFQMGDKDGEDDETPHQVTLTQGLIVATTVTTQGAWRKVMGSEPWKGKQYVREGDNYPAVYVSAEDGVLFCKRLNALEKKNGTLPEGWEYRLLTEAQWEYACRAGSTTKYHFGNSESELGQYGWFDVNAWDVGEKYAHEVGGKRPNQWGLFDMHGNIWEWTADTYANYPAGPVTDPHANGGSYCVYRGGSFFSTASLCRSSNRFRDSPGNRNNDLGFRVACVQLSSK